MGALRKLRRNLGDRLAGADEQKKPTIGASEDYTARSKTAIQGDYRKNLMVLGQRRYFRGKSYRGKENKKNFI